MRASRVPWGTVACLRIIWNIRTCHPALLNTLSNSNLIAVFVRGETRPRLIHPACPGDSWLGFLVSHSLHTSFPPSPLHPPSKEDATVGEQAFSEKSKGTPFRMQADPGLTAANRSAENRPRA